MNKVCIDLSFFSVQVAQRNPNWGHYPLTSEPLFTVRIQPLGELTPKFREIARPDRLPHASHGVKEEGQIVVGQQDTRQHLAGII